MANIVRRQASDVPTTARGHMPQHFDPLRLFRDILRWDPFAEMMPAQLDQQLGNFVPSFEIRETDNAYIFKADLPGVEDEDLEISISGNRLTVSGKREAESQKENDRFYAYERSYGSFSRSFTLPEQVESERISASLDNGVLTITVPKRPEAQPKKISVGSQAQPQQQPESKAKPKA